MNHKTQLTTRQIMREVLQEMRQMNTLDQLNVLYFVLRLWLRRGRSRQQFLNVALSFVVLALLVYLLKLEG